MKFAASTKSVPCRSRISLWLASALVIMWSASGCSKAPETPPAEQMQKSLDSQIESIQNSPNMSDAAKQQAIAGMKSQQARTTAQQ